MAPRLPFPLLAVALLLIISLATRTEAVARLQVDTTAATPGSVTNQALAQALAKLLRNNGTHANIPIQPPFPFNATIKTDTINMAGQLLQQLLTAQPFAVLQQVLLRGSSSSPARALLADDDKKLARLTSNPKGTPLLDGSNSTDTDALFNTTTSADNSTSKTPIQVANGRRVASRINVIMSDAWLVAYSGFKVAQVSFQLLAMMLSAGSSGTVTVDPALLLKFADVSTNFMSTVSYLLYGIQKLTAGAVSPLGLVRPVVPPPP